MGKELPIELRSNCFLSFEAHAISKLSFGAMPRGVEYNQYILSQIWNYDVPNLEDDSLNCVVYSGDRYVPNLEDNMMYTIF